MNIKKIKLKHTIVVIISNKNKNFRNFGTFSDYVNSEQVNVLWTQKFNLSEVFFSQWWKRFFVITLQNHLNWILFCSKFKFLVNIHFPCIQSQYFHSSFNIRFYHEPHSILLNFDLIEYKLWTFLNPTEFFNYLLCFPLKNPIIFQLYQIFRYLNMISY